MDQPSPYRPDNSGPVIAVPVDLIRVAGNPRLRVYAEMAVRARGGLIACSYRQVATWCGWRSYGTAAQYVAELTSLGALELVYPGTFRPGGVTMDANVYRLAATPVDNPPRRGGGRADGAVGTAPSRRGGDRARSSPSGNSGAAKSGGHRYPCYCDDCLAHLAALTAPDRE